jgi:hypothetical protein
MFKMKIIFLTLFFVGIDKATSSMETKITDATFEKCKTCTSNVSDDLTVSEKFQGYSTLDCASKCLKQDRCSGVFVCKGESSKLQCQMIFGTTRAMSQNHYCDVSAMKDEAPKTQCFILMKVSHIQSQSQFYLLPIKCMHGGESFCSFAS